MKKIFTADTAIVTYNGISKVVNHPTTIYTEDSATVTTTTLEPMPALGQPCTINHYYSYGGDMYKCRQTHNRTEHHPLTIPALFTFYRINAGEMEWVVGEQVNVNWERIYQGITYQCLQAHQTQIDWTPPLVPALWKSLDQRPPVAGVWGYPVAYNVNDIVTYQGHTYKCLQAHTSQAGWTPPAVPALWQLIS